MKTFSVFTHPAPENLVSPSLSSILSGREGGRRPGEDALRFRCRTVSSLVVLLAFALALFTASPCLAATSSMNVAVAFEAANKLYEQGKFADAAAAYEQLTESGTTAPALYFNLGNALFKAGQTGSAIAAYRQAQHLTPRDPDLRANLQFARDKVQGPTYHGTAWERWLSKLSLNEWTVAAAVAVWATFLLLAARFLWPKSAPSLRGWTILGGITAVVLCSLLGCAFAHREAVAIAVVTQQDTTVRTGPFDESPGVFTANNGAELRVLDTKDGWLQVTAGQRRIGWVKSDTVALPDRS